MSQPYQPGPYQPGPQVPGPQQPLGTQPHFSGPAAAQKSGFLDIRFTRFLSLNLISLWWVVALVVIAIGMVVGVVGGLMQMGDSPGLGFVWIIGALGGGVVLAVLTRLFLESVAVLFRIADNTARSGSDRRV